MSQGAVDVTSKAPHDPPPGGDEASSDPDDEGRLSRYLGRPLLLVFWTLVVWGTAYAALFAFAVATDGPADAFARATTGPGRAFGVANLALGVVALGVWSFVGLAVIRLRSTREDRDLE